MTYKYEYSAWIGLQKTVKNSAVLLVPFLLAVLASVPPKYGWISVPVVYFLKNWYENRD